MRRILASLLAALVAVVLAACSGATQDLGAGTSTGLQGQRPHARRRGLPDGVRRRQDLLPEPAAGGSALHDELPVRASRARTAWPPRPEAGPGPARSPTPACCHRERQCQRQCQRQRRGRGAAASRSTAPRTTSAGTPRASSALARTARRARNAPRTSVTWPRVAADPRDPLTSPPPLVESRPPPSTLVVVGPRTPPTQMLRTT